MGTSPVVRFRSKLNNSRAPISRPVRLSFCNPARCDALAGRHYGRGRIFYFIGLESTAVSIVTPVAHSVVLWSGGYSALLRLRKFGSAGRDNRSIAERTGGSFLFFLGLRKRRCGIYDGRTFITAELERTPCETRLLRRSTGGNSCNESCRGAPGKSMDFDSGYGYPSRIGRRLDRRITLPPAHTAQPLRFDRSCCCL